jgi:hypothetical protein
MVFFMPRHLCHKLGLRVGDFLRHAYSLPIILCMPMVAVLLLMHYWFVPHTRLQLAGQVLAAGLTYGLCMLWAFMTNNAFHVADLNPVGGQALFDVAVPTVSKGLY